MHENEIRNFEKQAKERNDEFIAHNYVAPKMITKYFIFNESKLKSFHHEHLNQKKTFN